VIEERTGGENRNTSYRETLYRPKPWMPKKRLHKEKLSAKPSLTLVSGPKNLKEPKMSNEIKMRQAGSIEARKYLSEGRKESGHHGGRCCLHLRG